MTYGHLQADCLYTGISSGPNARYRVWEAFTFLEADPEGLVGGQEWGAAGEEHEEGPGPSPEKKSIFFSLRLK